MVRLLCRRSAPPGLYFVVLPHFHIIGWVLLRHLLKRLMFAFIVCNLRLL